jgi:hypothetical protein
LAEALPTADVDAPFLSFLLLRLDFALGVGDDFLSYSIVIGDFIGVGGFNIDFRLEYLMSGELADSAQLPLTGFWSGLSAISFLSTVV